MKKTQILALFGCLILIAVCGITDAGEKISVNVEVPLPDDIKIVAPATDVPREIATFSGAWEGETGSTGTGAALIVEEINSKEVKVIFCRGERSGWSGSPAFCDRYKGIVTPEKQQIKFGPAEKYLFTFSMQNNLNQVKGTFKAGGMKDEFTMTKLK
jgi:hypothetical protein